jgi:eukaryotic-like serine/threonine-protein kinase
LKKLGKYEVLAELGRGAMGVVYCARDPIINRLVAVKTITTGVAADPGLLQRFYREAQSAGGLQHPNIVTIYDMGEQDDVPYIAMELIEGESFEKIIAHRTALPISLKLVYAVQACRAFDCAHKRGIVHRDIKPANIMVTKDGIVKVVDFGIARVVETSKTQTGMLIGTFAYMSPEQYHGEHADERSDIWSFGVLLYELFCSQKPFLGETPASLMHSICEDEPGPLSRFLPQCPRELELIIAKTLRKSSGERFQSMEDLLLELEPLCTRLQAQSVADLADHSRRCVEQNQFTEARDLLRQALQIDTGNQRVRAMLEKVNAELKRLLVRPKAQQFVKEGHAFLQEGKILDAKVAAEGALHLDSNFEPARDLQRIVREQMGRAQLVAGWLDAAKQHLAEGQPEQAEALLAQALQAEPFNKQAVGLQQQARKEAIERRKRLRLLERLQNARGLWTRQEYTACIQLLLDLGNEFPEEEEVSRLLETVRDDQVEQRQQALSDFRNLLSAGRYEECFALLAKLQEQFPKDQEIPALLETARKNQVEHSRLQRLTDAKGFLSAGQFEEGISLLTALSKEFPGEPQMAELLESAREGQREQAKQQRVTRARELLAARRYAESASLLMSLKKEFPGDTQILKLLDAVRNDQTSQRKRDALTEARSLLSSRRYDRAISALTELQADFPEETEIGKLLETARADQAEQYKQQKLSEARAHLASQSFVEAAGLLEALAAVYPKDSGVLKLRALVQREREKHARALRIERELDILKMLMSEKKYAEVISRTKQLLAEFPGETNFRRLAEFAASQQESLEKDLLLRGALQEAQAMFDANRFKESVAAAQRGLKSFPGSNELLNLRQEAEIHQRKQEVQRQIEARVRQIRVKINREELSEAIDLAKKTLVILGPDTHVSQLLNSAQVEMDAREKKKEQRRTLETIRTFIETGNVDAASQALDQALEAKAVDDFDPRIQHLSEQIKDAKSAPREPAPGSPPTPPIISREYAFFHRTPPSPPPAPDKPFLRGPSTSQGAATQRALSPQPAVSGPSPRATPQPPLQGAPPAQPGAAESPQQSNRSLEVPAASVERPQHSSNPQVFAIKSHHRASFLAWRRPAVVMLLVLGLVAAIWVGLRSVPPEPVRRPVPVDPPPILTADPALLEAQQRPALKAAGELIAANNLDSALEQLREAAALNGPLTPDLQRRISEIDESKKDPNLRQLRQREERLWQQALKQVEDGRFMDAQKKLRQIAGAGAGGVHRDDAKTYLDKVIPKRLEESDLLAQAHFDLTQEEFQSARTIAAQLKEKGSDSTALLGEIDLAEQIQIAKLKNRFNDLKQRDNDKAVQDLNALWPKFQELAAANGPQSGEALDYVNEIPEAMSDVQARMQQITADAVFQRMVKAYQQAARLNDKTGLTTAHTDFESIVKGDGAHADEAQNYLAAVNDKLAALGQSSPKTPTAAVNRENSVRTAIQLYSHAFDQKDADALLQIWPNAGPRYEGFKMWFDKASSVRMHVEIESVQFSSDGTTATVKAQVSRDYTPMDSKTTRFTDAQVFQLSKVSGAWLITDVQGHQ